MSVTLNDPDSSLNCYEAISTHSSNINVVPATYMQVSGTSPNCVVTVTPAPGVVGSSVITLTVTDGANVNTTSFTVNSYGAPSANATPVATAIVNRAYTGFTVSGSGGLAPYTYSVASGSLPSGITLNSSTGAVSGTPTTYGKFSNITFRVSDSGGGSSTTTAFDLYVASYYTDITASTTLDTGTTFARGSGGYRTASTGLLQAVGAGVPRYDWDPITAAAKGILVEEGRANLLTLSEHFEAPYGWATQQATLTADAAVAPDGNTSADFLKEDNSASAHLVRPAFVAKDNTNRRYSFSVYVKANGRTAVNLRLGNDSFSAYAQSICTLSSGGTAVASASGFTAPAGRVVALASGWYRCSVSGTSDTSTSVRPEIRLYDGASDSYSGNNTGGVYLWGAQLEEGAGPSSYIPARSLLTYGEELVAGRGFTTSQAAIFADDTAAPDGATTAERVADTSTGQLGSISRTLTGLSATGATYTVSVYVKKGASSIVALQAEPSGSFFNFPVDRGIALNTVTGNYTAINGGYSAPSAVRVEDAGTYWRVAFPVSTEDNGSANQIKLNLIPAWATALNGSGLSSTTNSQNNAQGSAYFWGLQVEAGSLPATLLPYFQRDTATNRAPDLMDIPSIASGAFNATEGTMISTVGFDSTPSSTATALCFSDGTTTNRISHNYTATLAALEISAGAATQTPATKPQVPLGVMKMAAAYKANDLGIAVNGALGGTSTQATLPPVSRLRLGRTEGDTNFLNGHLRGFLYFPNRLPNSLLPNLSL